MKVKMWQVVDAMAALAVFANALTQEEKDADEEGGKPEKVAADRKATAKERYAVGKLIRKMNAEHSDYQKDHNLAVRRYGEKKSIPDGKGGTRETWVVKDENEFTFAQEIYELREADVDLGEVIKIPWSYVEKVNPVPSVMADLMDFMDPPQGEKAPPVLEHKPPKAPGAEEPAEENPTQEQLH